MPLPALLARPVVQPLKTPILKAHADSTPGLVVQRPGWSSTW